MPRPSRRTADAPAWTTLKDALRTFAGCEQKTQSQRHIKPLHWYTASRLVLEGGFRPEYVTPRVPFKIRESNGQMFLEHDPSVALSGEHTLFGGLKTKAVDVTVSVPGIGPVIAVSMKGTLGAFRNLTNRMEEAAGDCTNIHLAYPGLVYAFWHIFRANVAGLAPANTPAMLKLDENGHFKAPDVALHADRSLSSYLARYLFAMQRLSGRKDMRNDPSSYEAVAVTLVDVAEGCSGSIVAEHPPTDSELRYDRMFATIYRQFDLRFVYQSPALKSLTRRLSWSEDSPALSAITGMDFDPRIGVIEADDDEADAMEDAADES
jgi:hypothetical protein